MPKATASKTTPVDATPETPDVPVATSATADFDSTMLDANGVGMIADTGALLLKGLAADVERSAEHETLRAAIREAKGARVRVTIEPLT